MEIEYKRKRTLNHRAERACGYRSNLLMMDIKYDFKANPFKEKDGKPVPKINLSENVRKITIPSSKQVYRLIDKDSGKAIADVLTLDDEIIDETKPYVLFDPDFTWKRKEIENFVTRKLLVPIFEGGKKVYEEPSLKEIRDYCLRQTDTLWDEVKRFENPHKYYVDLSKNLWAERNSLIEKFKGIK